MAADGEKETVASAADVEGGGGGGGGEVERVKLEELLAKIEELAIGDTIAITKATLGCCYICPSKHEADKVTLPVVDDSSEVLLLPPADDEDYDDCSHQNSSVRTAKLARIYGKLNSKQLKAILNRKKENTSGATKATFLMRLVRTTPLTELTTRELQACCKANSVKICNDKIDMVNKLLRSTVKKAPKAAPKAPKAPKSVEDKLANVSENYENDLKSWITSLNDLAKAMKQEQALLSLEGNDHANPFPDFIIKSRQAVEAHVAKRKDLQRKYNEEMAETKKLMSSLQAAMEMKQGQGSRSKVKKPKR